MLIFDALQKHWKKLLALLGVSALLDMAKEYFRARLMDWLADSLGPFSKWLLANPSALLTIAVVLALMWLAVLLVREHTRPPSSLILDHKERPIPARPSSKSILLSICVAVVVVFGVGYGWRSYHRAAEKPRTPAPPGGLQLGIYSAGPFRMGEGRIVPFKKRELPCAYGKSSGHGLRGLRDLPGGPQLKRPSLVVSAKRYFLNEWQNEDKGIDLLFYVEITNRGETSIAKDWSLCLVQDNKATYFEPDSLESGYSNFVPAGHSLVESISHTPIEHGHMVEGWLLFRLRKNAINTDSFSGSLGCRDYLDQQFFMTFSTE